VGWATAETTVDTSDSQTTCIMGTQHQPTSSLPPAERGEHSLPALRRSRLHREKFAMMRNLE